MHTLSYSYGGVGQSHGTLIKPMEAIIWGPGKQSWRSSFSSSSLSLISHRDLPCCLRLLLHANPRPSLLSLPPFLPPKGASKAVQQRRAERVSQQRWSPQHHHTARFVTWSRQTSRSRAPASDATRRAGLGWAGPGATGRNPSAH